MTYPASTDAPIYDRLVQERGDVLAEARRVAEQAARQVAQTRDFSSMGTPPTHG